MTLKFQILIGENPIKTKNVSQKRRMLPETSVAFKRPGRFSAIAETNSFKAQSPYDFGLFCMKKASTYDFVETFFVLRGRDLNHRTSGL